MPFFNTPEKATFKNNKSALDNIDFVTKSIEELLKSNSVIESEKQPHVVKPLSVPQNSAGKKILILDLRHVNKHIYKEFISFDDWKSLTVIALNLI